MVVADEKTASQRAVTRPSILRRALEFIPTPPTPHLHQFRRLYYTHPYLHKSLHTDRINLHTLKQQPTEAPEAEPNKMKM